jgi:hypothetical protein
VPPLATIKSMRVVTEVLCRLLDQANATPRSPLNTCHYWTRDAARCVCTERRLFDKTRSVLCAQHVNLCEVYYNSDMHYPYLGRPPMDHRRGTSEARSADFVDREVVLREYGFAHLRAGCDRRPVQPVDEQIRDAGFAERFNASRNAGHPGPQAAFAPG